jgi:hypothetical protein
MRQAFERGFVAEFYVRNTQGQPVPSADANQLLLDITNPAYQDYCVAFIRDRLLASGLYDGVFCDTMSYGLAEWLQNARGANIDMDGDGVATDPKVLHKMWADGISAFVRRLRTALPNKSIVFNGWQFEFRFADGGLFEDCLNPEKGWHGKRIPALVPLIQNWESMPIVNTCGDTPDADRQRAGLALALLTDAYAVDDATAHQNDTRWSSDYTVRLGPPEGPAVRAEGGWLRRFKYGAVALSDEGVGFLYRRVT